LIKQISNSHFYFHDDVIYMSGFVW